LPDGFTLQRWGTRRAIASNSSSASGIPAWCAIARRCRTLFVDPPSAMSTAMAFSMASRVTIRRGVRFCRKHSMTSRPASRARAGRRGSTASIVAHPVGDIPSASRRQAMVLAVPIMEHEPGPGRAAFSISVSSTRLSLPIFT